MRLHLRITFWNRACVLKVFLCFPTPQAVSAAFLFLSCRDIYVAKQNWKTK